jgi:hypothetical protein
MEHRPRDAGFDAAILEITFAPIDEQRALFARQMSEKDVVGPVADEVGDVDASRFGDAIGIDRDAPDVSFLNVPSFRLIHSWLGLPSLAM